MLNDKRLVFAAGGTGGHINPALAVAGEIKKRYPGAEIIFIGTAVKMEARLVPAAGFELRTIRISGFKREISPAGLRHNIKTVYYLLTSGRAVKKILRDFRPDIVIGFGGYVSGPVVRTAAKMGKPTAIHEQNAFPGVTNKTLAKSADAVMLTTQQAEKYMSAKNKPVITGLPVRGELLEADRLESRKKLNVDSLPMVLSMGGSLGARAINECMLETIAARWRKGDIFFMHATGRDSYEQFRSDLAEKGVDENAPNVVIRDYVDDMAECLSAADLVICRAGASSISEFQALGKPSVLIPYPYAAENHQYFNAKVLADNGAAILIEEKDLSSGVLLEKLDMLLESPGRLEKMGRAASSMAVLNATDRIIEVIERTVATREKTDG